jgi:hypothetical protein
VSCDHPEIRRAGRKIRFDLLLQAVIKSDFMAPKGSLGGAIIIVFGNRNEPNHIELLLSRRSLTPAIYMKVAPLRLAIRIRQLRGIFEIDLTPKDARI